MWRAASGMAGCGVAGCLALLAVLALTLAGPALGKGTKHKPPGPTPVSVTVDVSHPGTPVPPDFLGLSFELSSLGQIAADAEAGDLVTLLRSLGPGASALAGGPPTRGSRGRTGTRRGPPGRRAWWTPRTCASSEF